MSSTDSMPARYAASLQPLGVRILETGLETTYRERECRIVTEPGIADAATVIEVAAETWDELTRDLEACAGMIYGGRVERVRGDLMQLMHWEPALRWLFVKRPIYDVDDEPFAFGGEVGGEVQAHERPDPARPGALALDRSFDPCRGFAPDDDPDEMRAYLEHVGYLWVRGVFSEEEVAMLQSEAEALRKNACEGDQESWWGRNDKGETVLCRVLRAGTQPKMRSLHGDPRLTRLAELCAVPMVKKQGPEDKDGVTVLWKQPGVVEGLGDLPWHRDCGMGGHASMCPTAVQSIFLGPNTPEAGEIRFLPGSWKKSLPFAEGDADNAPRGVAPPAMPGDVTFHYGDGLHVAPAPTGREGPFRTCVLIGYQRADGGHHKDGRHYNDQLLGSEDGQIEHMSQVAKRR